MFSRFCRLVQPSYEAIYFLIFKRRDVKRHLVQRNPKFALQTGARIIALARALVQTRVHVLVYSAIPEPLSKPKDSIYLQQKRPRFHEMRGKAYAMYVLKNALKGTTNPRAILTSFWWFTQTV